MENTEAVLKSCLNDKNVVKKGFIPYITNYSFDDYIKNNEFHFLKDHEDGHDILIIKSLIKTYIITRVKRFIKSKNIERKKKLLRKKLTKLIHFNNS